MPTYEYRCQNCLRTLEEFQRMSDTPLVTCPFCGHDTLARIVSGGAGVIYKGEGWYVTDYSKKASGGKDSDSPTKTTSTVSTKPAGETQSSTNSETSASTPPNPAPTPPAVVPTKEST